MRICGVKRHPLARSGPPREKWTKKSGLELSARWDLRLPIPYGAFRNTPLSGMLQAYRHPRNALPIGRDHGLPAPPSRVNGGRYRWDAAPGTEAAAVALGRSGQETPANPLREREGDGPKRGRPYPRLGTATTFPRATGPRTPNSRETENATHALPPSPKSISPQRASTWARNLPRNLRSG